jgi:hypothetical protein
MVETALLVYKQHPRRISYLWAKMVKIETEDKTPIIEG